MCKVKSMILLKNKVYCPLDHDSHTKMLEELNIEDNIDNSTVKFVRAELTPKDNDIFNHNLDNWQLYVDQSNKPEWYNEFVAEERCKKELSKWFAERFIIDDKSWRHIQGQRFYIKNSNVVAKDKSSVEAWGDSHVEAYNDSSIKAWGDSTVVAKDKSRVVAKDKSSVVARDKSSVRACDTSSVRACDTSSVVAWDKSSVVARQSSHVEAYNDSSIKAWGKSSVVALDKSSVITIYSRDVIFEAKA